MADLLEWLTGCLDHLEAVAVAASRSDATTWTVDMEGFGHVSDDRDGAVVYDETGTPSEEQATHIALHDPRAVLARVEAERAIIADSRDAQRFYQSDEEREATDRTLRLLAWGHRFDFPGYDTEAWAPEGADRG